jgi:hypothetical protein
MSRVITIQEGQTIRDIAMQYYGCAEGVQRIAKLNNMGYALLTPGSTLLVDNFAPVLTDTNLQIVKYYQRMAVVVNSSYRKQPAPILGGFPYTLPFTLS